jgi:hypothetical protein
MEAQLPEEEKALLLKSLDPAVVIRYFTESQKLFTVKHEKGKAGRTLVERVGRLSIEFVRLATSLDPIISAVLPTSPEYAIPYGCLKVIFKVSDASAAMRTSSDDILQFILDNADKQEDVVGQLTTLGDILHTISFHNDMEPTGAMKKLMATIYVQVLDFLERVIDYTNLTPLGEPLGLSVSFLLD